MTKCSRSLRIASRSPHAPKRFSSHVSLKPVSSSISERLRSRCISRSKPRRVVRVTSIKSVSAGERFRCVAAGFSLLVEAVVSPDKHTFSKLLEPLHIVCVELFGFVFYGIVLLHPFVKLFAGGKTRDRSGCCIHEVFEVVEEVYGWQLFEKLGIRCQIGEDSKSPEI